MYAHANRESSDKVHNAALTCSPGRTTMLAMNWTLLIADIRTRGLTFADIAEQIGTSKGHVHDVYTMRHTDVMWSMGQKLITLHRKVMRRKVK